MEEEIKKLRSVVNSPNIGEALKAKAQARIDMLEEKAGKSTPAPKPDPKAKKEKKAPVKKEKAEKPKKERKESAIDYAKRTRKSGESWQDAIKRASKELKNGGKPVAKKIKRTEKKAKPVAKKIKRTKAKSKPAPKKIKRTVKAKPAPKKIKRVAKKQYLTGSTDKSVDKHIKALKPGKRISKNGNTYYERRANRADLNRTKKLEKGGELGDNYNIVYDKPNSDVAWKKTINAKSEQEAVSKFKKEYPSFEILSIRKSI